MPRLYRYTQQIALQGTQMAMTDYIAILEQHWIQRPGELLGKLSVFVALILWVLGAEYSCPGHVLPWLWRK